MKNRHTGVSRKAFDRLLAIINGTTSTKPLSEKAKKYLDLAMNRSKVEIDKGHLVEICDDIVKNSKPSDSEIQELINSNLEDILA